MRLVLVPNGVPTWRGGRRNFIPTFVKDGLLESLLSSKPILIELGWVCQEWNDLMPPPMYWVKENFDSRYKRTSHSSRIKAMKWYVVGMLLCIVDLTSKSALKTLNLCNHRDHLRWIDNNSRKGWPNSYVGWMGGTFMVSMSSVGESKVFCWVFFFNFDKIFSSVSWDLDYLSKAKSYVFVQTIIGARQKQCPCLCYNLN